MFAAFVNLNNQQIDDKRYIKIIVESVTGTNIIINTYISYG